MYGTVCYRALYNYPECLLISDIFSFLNFEVDGYCSQRKNIVSTARVYFKNSENYPFDYVPNRFRANDFERIWFH